MPVRHGGRDLLAHHGDVAALVLVAEGGLHDQALAAVILACGAGQAIAHCRRSRSRTRPVRSKPRKSVSTWRARSRVADDVRRPWAEPDLDAQHLGRGGVGPFGTQADGRGEAGHLVPEPAAR